ncbi:hypothetical protein [Nocardioides psychrotolerans]|uniref:AbiTii domain-containing protein n=1 Tax=Nocardioides psychrotolerans TaxID=1005945 RepID=UPI00313826DE
MTDTVLQSLRERVLDETEPLAGLLRKCLILGADTGSDSLRNWARLELNGYGDDDDVPSYRRLPNPTITYDSMSGNTWMTNGTMDALQLPAEAREHMPGYLACKQPIEELEELAKTKAVSMRTGHLSFSEMVWNSKLSPFQQVMNLRYSMTGSVFTGLVGQVRTKLVDIVADLTAGVPLTELPPTARVDEVMRERVGHVGDIYNTNVNYPTGPTAVGQEAIAKSEGMTVAEVIALLAEIQRTLASAPAGTARDEAGSALVELREVVEQDKPDRGEVVRRTGRLRAAIGRLGNAGATAATSRAAEALTDMAMNGQFS